MTLISIQGAFGFFRGNRMMIVVFGWSLTSLFLLMFSATVAVWFFVEKIKIFFFEGFHHLIQEYSKERAVRKRLRNLKV